MRASAATVCVRVRAYDGLSTLLLSQVLGYRHSPRRKCLEYARLAASEGHDKTVAWSAQHV